MGAHLTIALAFALQSAPDFLTRNAAELAANPSDLSFQIHTPKTAYHLGERIPILFEFSTSSIDKFGLRFTNPDFRTDDFILDHTGVVDPSVDYNRFPFNFNRITGMQGMPQVLKEKHFEIDKSLNDHFRFDTPGRYRLYVKSRRLVRADQGNAVNFVMTSNVLAFEILPPDPNWQAAKLAAIKDALDQQSPTAYSELQSLATPDAIRFLLAYARKKNQSPDKRALAAARDRPQMLADFDEFLRDPSAEFTTSDIQFRAILPLLQNPQPPAGELVNRAIREQVSRLIPVCRQKQDGPHAVCANAITQLDRRAAELAGLAPPDISTLSKSGLIAQFPKLPFGEQYALLDRKWNLIRDPAMIPHLEQLAASSNHIAESALTRLRQLSPERAAAILRAGIASQDRRFHEYALYKWPAGEAIDLDSVLLERFESNLPLIAKLGSAKLMAPMLASYEAGTRTCYEQVLFLSYFLRVQPSPGAEMLRAALALPNALTCSNMLLGQLGPIAWTPELHAFALAILDNPNPEAASNAAEALGKFAPSGAEPFLWKRVERWSQTWTGRAAELHDHPITRSNPNLRERTLGYALFNSLASAKSWVLDPQRQSRLHALCIDDDCRNRFSAEPDNPIPIASSDPAGFEIQGYIARSLTEFKPKLLQYPSQTRFRWCPGPSSPYTPTEKAEISNELNTFLPGRIDPCPPTP